MARHPLRSKSKCITKDGALVRQFHDYISLLIKPTEMCNLRCIYCFHRDEGYSKQIMDIDTLEKIYAITFPHYKQVSITWHGGEPTCAGIEFYRIAFDLQKKYAKKYNVTVKNSMQTNGTQLSEDFIKMLIDEHVSLGVSDDGCINDITRGSTILLEENRKRMADYGLHSGVITVVNRLNVDRLIENYELMKKRKIGFQLNHYVETDSRHPLKELHLEYENYIKRMEEFFNYWINDSDCNIDVQPFTQIIIEIIAKCATVCTRASCHRSWMCIDCKGNITPCDKKFPDKYNFGNINDYSDIREVYSSEGFGNLLKDVIERRKKCQNSCEYYSYCEGGCSHSALVETGITETGGFSCKSQKFMLKMVIDYINNNSITVDNFSEIIPNKYLNRVLEKKLNGTKCTKS